jgi:hypothetical protein
MLILEALVIVTLWDIVGKKSHFFLWSDDEDMMIGLIIS